jgi:Ca-activated chloride channel homolog
LNTFATGGYGSMNDAKIHLKEYLEFYSFAPLYHRRVKTSRSYPPTEHTRRGDMSAYIRLPFGCIAVFSLCLVFALNAQDQKSSSPTGTVSLTVSVWDPINRPITDLQKENFRVFEDKVEQPIASVSRQDDPISLVIAWDISASMRTEGVFEKAKTAVGRLLSARHREDECFLITFSESAVIQTITSGAPQTEVRIDKKRNRLTAMYDAVYMGLDRLNHAQHAKKALVIISDGQDNSSRHSESDIRKFAKESDVQVFGILDSEHQGYLRIMNIVNATGGRIFTVYMGGNMFPNQYTPEACAQMLLDELQCQYSISYRPHNNNRDGKWRKIKVKLNAPPGLPKLTVRTREGRYAPNN